MININGLRAEPWKFPEKLGEKKIMTLIESDQNLSALYAVFVIQN